MCLTCFGEEGDYYASSADESFPFSEVFPEGSSGQVSKLPSYHQTWWLSDLVVCLSVVITAGNVLRRFYLEASLTCYYPITLYRSRQGRDKVTGKWPLVTMQNGFRDMPGKVACGRCIGCRLERSRQWAIRCVNEASMHKENSFITLTYDDENLPIGKFVRPTLKPRDLQLFFKRLRKRHGNGIRFFACGEYGERFGRPHYHACVFGLDFQDKTFYSSKNGINIYTSRGLSELWPFGHNAIGDVNFETAAYVARYVVDKKLGKEASYYLQHGIEPEFVRMSRRPGVGASWLSRYAGDIYPHDYMVIRGGIKCKPPKFYDLKYELDNLDEFKYIREQRKLNGYSHSKDSTPSRLQVREEVKLSQIKSLRR